MNQNLFYNNQDNDNDQDQEDSDAVQSKEDEIKEFGAVVTNTNKPIYCLTIIGQIEGHFVLPSTNKTTKYEHVIPQIVAIEEEPNIKGVLIILNTVGGDVEAGLALAELIVGMKKPVVTLVLGGGHSIGVPLAVSSKRSFIVPSATMTIHPVRMTGLVVGVPQTYSYFEKMQDRIVKFVCNNSNVNEDDFREMLHNKCELATDIGTVLTGDEAVACGLIDQTGSLKDAIDCLYEMINQNSNDEENSQNKDNSETKGD